MENKIEEPMISVLGYQKTYPSLNEKTKKENLGLYSLVLVRIILEEFLKNGMIVKRINKGIKKGTKITYESLGHKPKTKIIYLRNTMDILDELFDVLVDEKIIDSLTVEGEDIRCFAKKVKEIISKKIDNFEKELNKQK